ncbi:3-hexulose-6-phosphate synthase/6-phospho-3-hexuloisomerase [Methanocalculus sp. AMF5]|uniref:orotidine 5'-phosphate decarboxylase / HUMPS family protein n=2 Tax=unclassified Methanocalculus TaxID=2631035 RepID=UPI00209D828B|nr:orotidine 5'-phosphate decarboxylase / HUMPS family protein [Methanocalculus sp. AMF5]MCP1663064.1 3-hexulose-6-phosphate synthase/6-phospho-3-hexuloisomerase [Methanocalculus sp. AMF5]
MTPPILQVALDIPDLSRAYAIAGETLAGGADWIEIGTPLIKSEGMHAVREIRAHHPDTPIVADMKTSDTGALEVEMAAKAGAGIVCILAESDDAVIREAVKAADLYGVQLMGDMMNVGDPVTRARELEEMGVHIINAHVGIDQQMIGKDSLELLERLTGTVSIPVAAAGGLDAARAAQAVAHGAAIVIIGGAIIRSGDVTESTRSIRSAIDAPVKRAIAQESRDDEIRRMLMQVSSSNVSDAMHRKGAMSGLTRYAGTGKMIGQAVTVQTFAGDWAKPVEAIDTADPGDVIVINNSRDRTIAPWGELATLSCQNKGISGVIIDGAVRDLDDILDMTTPLYATASVPNAGEPKGFGEINAEIRCCGQVVRAGDWIIGDASGVVVIPKEHAYEISRRAVLVARTEERLREEIRRGSTLSVVMELLRWEKQ